MFADYTDDAWTDIHSIIDFLADSSPRAAPRFIDELLKTIEKLLAFPTSAPNSRS